MSDREVMTALEASYYHKPEVQMARRDVYLRAAREASDHVFQMVSVGAMATKDAQDYVAAWAKGALGDYDRQFGPNPTILKTKDPDQ